MKIHSFRALSWLSFATLILTGCSDPGANSTAEETSVQSDFDDQEASVSIDSTASPIASTSTVTATSGSTASATASVTTRPQFKLPETLPENKNLPLDPALIPEHTESLHPGSDPRISESTHVIPKPSKTTAPKGKGSSTRTGTHTSPSGKVTGAKPGLSTSKKTSTRTSRSTATATGKLPKSGTKPGSDKDADADGYTSAQGDCNDRDAAVHPDRKDCAERPKGLKGDGKDNDCDGEIDEDDCRFGKGPGKKPLVDTPIPVPTDTGTNSKTDTMSDTDVESETEDDVTSDTATQTDADTASNTTSDTVTNTATDTAIESADGTTEATSTATDSSTAETTTPTDAATENDFLKAVDGVNIWQIPYFENSSPWGGITDLSDEGYLFYTSETGLYYRNVNEEGYRWKRFFNFEDYHGKNFFNGAVGMAMQDPLGAIYFCTGTTGYWGNGGVVDAFIYHDMGGIFRADKNLNLAVQMAGHKKAWERLTIGCPGDGYARYIIETEPNPDIEMWVLANRAPVMAFDDREAGADGTYSKVFYHITHNRGLYRATLDDDGEVETWDALHYTPSLYDTGEAGGVFDAAGFSSDSLYYEYKPQTTTDTDRRDRYDPDSGTNCNYEIDGLMVYGDYDSSEKKCIEHEKHGIGTFVILDPVYHAYNKSNNVKTKAILYAGYMVQPTWPDGGLYRIIIDSAGKATATEITFTKDTGEVIHLDARDMNCDAQQKTTIGSGTSLAQNEQIAKYCYVAGGRNGVFKLTMGSDLQTTVTPLSESDGTFTFKTRDDYMEECAGTTCTDTVSYQAAGIDQTYIDGVSYLALAMTHGKTYWAKEDFSGTLSWHDISGTGSSWNLVLDARTRTLYTGSNGTLAHVSFDDVLAGTPEWVDEEMGDRASAQVVFDRSDPRRLHFPGLDPTYSTVAWNEDMSERLEYYRPMELGFCYGMTYDMSEGINVSQAADVFRYDSYGINVYTSVNVETGKDVLYVGAVHFNGLYDGATHRGEWDDTLGDYKWALATGDHGSDGGACSATKHYSAATVCFNQCDESKSANALPTGWMSHLIVDPQDDRKIYAVIKTSSSENWKLYKSEDRGANWSYYGKDVFVYGKAGGTTLGSSVANLYKIIADPQDRDIFYLFFHYNYGIFKLDLNKGYVESISNPDTTVDNVQNATTLGTYNGATYTIGSDTLYKIPNIYDMQATIDEDSGMTRLTIAVTPYVDSGWGVFPESSATFSGGGGLYTRLINNNDATADAAIQWEKLNTADAELSHFMAYRFSFSTLNPKIGCMAGPNYFAWTSGGNPPDVTAGIACTKDGGATWFRPFTGLVNPTSITASLTDANVFAFSVQGGGLWLMDLSGYSDTGDIN